MNVKRKIFYIHNGDNYKDERLQFDHSFAELDSIELINQLLTFNIRVRKVSEIVPPFNDRTEVTITVYMWMQDEHIYHATMYSEAGYTETFLYELTRIKKEAV
jgi:hypothetical protein